jgi:hypothetical protein
MSRRSGHIPLLHVQAFRRPAHFFAIPAHVLANIMDSADVRMIERGGEASFGDEARTDSLVSHGVGHIDQRLTASAQGSRFIFRNRGA